jgi:signal transduction histidine kinase
MLLTIFVGVVYLLTAFHDAHLHLEEIVAQRTAALPAEIAERTRLEVAKIRSERLSVVGKMAAEMAHEVRKPLGSIALNLVLSDMLDPKLAFLHDEFERAKVKLPIEFDPARPEVNADAEQLWQAMLNLIRNGLEAMPNGGELTVSTKRHDRQAILRVRDNGCGMTDAQIKRVFDPFFTTKPGGTGLGLALVHQIVSEHGGRVECESAPGMGRGREYGSLRPSIRRA